MFSFHLNLFFNWQKWASIIITVNLEQSLDRETFEVGDNRQHDWAVHCDFHHNVWLTVNIFAAENVRVDTPNCLCQNLDM